MSNGISRSTPEPPKRRTTFEPLGPRLKVYDNVKNVWWNYDCGTVVSELYLGVLFETGRAMSLN